MVSRLPVVTRVLAAARSLNAERTQPSFGLAAVRLHPRAALPYPIDLAPLLALPFGTLDSEGVLYNAPHGARDGAYQPTSIAQYGLAQWNAWLADERGERIEAFLAQARWLLAHETRLANGAGVWPIPFPSTGYGSPGPWLSAMTQGNALSVLVRAYHHTRDERFLECARRATRSFELDIFEGGVSAPVAGNGLFFEDVATYPAARILNGYVLALFGLLDYVQVTGDEKVEALAQRSLRTLHDLAPGYDLGYWSSYDLLHRQPATRFYHALHVALLRALGETTGCAHCTALAERWDRYQRSAWNRVRSIVVSRALRIQAARVARRAAAVRKSTDQTPNDAAARDRRERVLVTITGFPIAGGMRSVLAGVSAVMDAEWDLEYVTRAVGSDAAGHTIHGYERRYGLFGPEATSPSQYPNALLYQREGRRMLKRLMRQRAYTVALPQDGAFTAAYTGPVARRYGARVVTMDHGNVTLPESAFFKAQRAAEYARRPQPRRALEHLRFALYVRTLRRLIQRAARASDTFLVAGDEVQDTYVRLYGVSPGLIIRYPYWVDSAALAPLGLKERADLRAQLKLPSRPVLIALISRLTDEKGFDVALAAIERARMLAGPEATRSVGVVIAGNGPLRADIEAELHARGLADITLLWGEASRADVVNLLRASDIFVYAGKRGTNYSVAVLEAMAAGCAVIATASPISNVRLLADGRGVALDMPADAALMAEPLAALIANEESRKRMGAAARRYVEERHSAEALRQALWRAVGWAPALEQFVEQAPAQAAKP